MSLEIYATQKSTESLLLAVFGGKADISQRPMHVEAFGHIHLMLSFSLGERWGSRNMWFPVELVGTVCAPHPVT
jgi:hypothetical protein